MAEQLAVETVGQDNVYNRNNEIVAVEITDEFITVTLCDRRRVSAPLDWFPWLQNASPEQRQQFTMHARTLDWEAFDDGMSIEPFLLGLPDTA